ncbi:MAG TPA: OB-fold domain-containing protein [Bryobacteraceae bacterium]|nr:OB-fold domain-containing protein [Bryobacteraceae bacterium]
MSSAAANQLGSGTVYTETVVYSPPEAYVNDVPYQLAIVQLDSGRRITGRIEGERAHIGDRVAFAEFRNSVPFFRKQP